MSSSTLRTLAAARGADTRRATVRELAKVLAGHLRDVNPIVRAQEADDLRAVAIFLYALADVSTPAAQFELRALAREIGGRR